MNVTVASLVCLLTAVWLIKVCFLISCGYLFSSEKNSKTTIERNFSQYKLNVDLVSNMLFELNCKVFFSLKKMLLFKSLHSNDLVYFDTVYIVVDWVYGRVQLKISHNQNFELKKYLLDLMFQKYEYFMMQFKNIFLISSVKWKRIHLVTVLIVALIKIAQ